MSVIKALLLTDVVDSTRLAEKLGDTLEARNLRSRQGDGDIFFSRMRRAFG